MMTKTATPTDAIAELDARLAELRAKSDRLAAERGRARRRHDAARSQLLTVKAHALAGEDVKADLAKAEKAEAEARAAAIASEERDWAGDQQAIEVAIRKVTQQRGEAIAANAVPLIDELVPEAEATNVRIIDLAEELVAAIDQHAEIMRKAERVLQHVDHYDRHHDIPAGADDFHDLRDLLTRLQSEGVSWPLPDLRKPPHKLAFLSEADRDEAWTPPAAA